MKLKLNEYWIGKLLQCPEAGMGYQQVDVLLYSGKIIKNITVLNAEDLLLPDQYAGLKLDEIKDLIITGKK